MKDIKKAYLLNICIAVLVLFSAIWMFSGLRLPGTGPMLSSKRIGIFRFFTVDSNLLMGVFAIIAALDYKKILDGKSDKLPSRDYILVFMGTVSVTLTMLVTVFYLAPTAEKGWISCFSNSNFFFHMIIPVLSIYTLIRYEKTNRLKWTNSLWGTVPMIVYAVFYAVNGIAHYSDGKVPAEHDFYGFFYWGLKSIAIVFPVILVLTAAICIVLYRLSHVKD